MNKELARTLTVALVSYLDENRPEGTMDCSSAECEAIEQAFIADNFFYVETLVQRKLSRLTEFEEKLVSFALQCNGEFDVAREEAAKWSKELLALAKKELQPEIDAEVDKAYKNADEVMYRKGKEEALKDLPVWRIWGNGACGNSADIPIAIVKRYDGYKLVSCLGVSGEKYIMLSELEKLPCFNEPSVEHFPATAINVPTWTPPCYNGGPCTNPHKDCINCPRANMVISPNTASGTSTSKAEG